VRRLLDSHLHTWERDKHPQPWLDAQPMAAIDRDFPPAAAVTELAVHGVDGCVAVQCVNDFSETVDLLATAQTLAPVRGVVGWLDLTADVPAQVRSLRGSPGGDLLVGVRHVTFAEPDVRWLARDDVRRGLAAIGDAGLAYDLLIAHHQLPLAAQVARDLPGTRFVLDHLGKAPLRSTELVTWARDLTDLARCPNVTMKVSGIVTEDDWYSWSTHRLRPVIDHALATFGPQRLLFGSDWPVVELAGGYGPWLEAYLELTDDLPADERAAIDGGNAIRTYGLA
jgi:L-fuconolactonase